MSFSEAPFNTIPVPVLVSAIVYRAMMITAKLTAILVMAPYVVSADSRLRVTELILILVRVTNTPRLIIRPPRLIVFIASRSFLGLFFRFNQEMFRTWFPKNLGRDGEEEAKS